MRKCNDEVYQLAKDQALGVMFVTRGSKNSLFSVFDFLSNLDCGQNQITDADEACRSSVISVDLIIIIVYL
jgi:hypothetical protein